MDTYNFQYGIRQTTRSGIVEGMEDAERGIWGWLGIPYAKPPVGELRWRAPQQPDAWEGVREAKRFASCSLQLQWPDGTAVGSEDCLYLNLWRPAHDRVHLPVLVFVHGGGNMNASGEEFKGDVLCRRTDSVIVSINYRLGAMGWFRSKALATGDPLDDSGNYGLLDIIQALRWVQDHIRSFGGDPGNVTVAGQSAGARNIMALTISPLAAGLYAKAVCLSGGMTLVETGLGERFADEVASRLLLQDGRADSPAEAERWLRSSDARDVAAYLRSRSGEEFLPLVGPGQIRMNRFPHLFKDGYVIPEAGFQLLKEESYRKVPMIIGSTLDEFSGFLFFEPDFMSDVQTGKLLEDPHKLALYTLAKTFGSKLYAGFNADAVAEALHESAAPPPVYVFRFAWGANSEVVASPLPELFGSSHGADVDFWTGHEEGMLNRMHPGAYYTPHNKPGRMELSERMMTYLGNLLHTGDPNGEQSGLTPWLPWHSDRQERILLLDADNHHARIRMSADMYRRQHILQEMHDTLDPHTIQYLTGVLFKDRFFWQLPQ